MREIEKNQQEMTEQYVFSVRKRVNRRAANHGESLFEFLDNSDLPTVARIRALLQDWFERYPQPKRGSLRERLRDDFTAGFSELLIHEILLQLYGVVEVDPDVGVTSPRTPDFRVHEPDGRSTYIEVTVVSEEDTTERGQRNAIGRFYDAVNQITLPDYFLAVGHVRQRGDGLSARRFKRWLLEWVSSENYDELLAIARRDRILDLPSRVYREDGGSSIEIRLIPVKPERRGADDHKNIAWHPGGSRWGSSAPAIRKKLSGKGRRYPQLDGPLLVFTNLSSPWPSLPHDMLVALFGPDYERGILQQPKSREPSLWRGRDGPQYTRIATVLFSRVMPWNLATAELHTVLNPWAEPTYAGRLLEFPTTWMGTAALKTRGGTALAELLNVEPSWPGELFDA
jgi:hypothetical protein